MKNYSIHDTVHVRVRRARARDVGAGRSSDVDGARTTTRRNPARHAHLRVLRLE